MLGGMILTFSCNDKGTSSPYDELFRQPPYSSLTDSIKQQPSNDVLYFRRAVLLNKNNLTAPALADFQKAWSLKKDEKYAFGISTVWLDEKPDSAIHFLTGALTELPQSVLLKINLARAYDGVDKTDKAIEICDQILSIDSTVADVLKMKSAFLEKKGSASESLAVLEKAYMLTPFDVNLIMISLLNMQKAKIQGYCSFAIH